MFGVLGHQQSSKVQILSMTMIILHKVAFGAIKSHKAQLHEGKSSATGRHFIPFFLNSSIYYTVKEQKNWGLIASIPTSITLEMSLTFLPLHYQILAVSCQVLLNTFHVLILYVMKSLWDPPEWLLMLFRVGSSSVIFAFIYISSGAHLISS